MTRPENSDGPSSSDAPPIFILGVLPRCGTNFLADLVCAHPDCAPPEPIWEDFLVYHAGQLEGYARRVRGQWNPAWGVGERDEAELLADLGAGLVSFLARRTGGRRLVTKTPRVDNLHLFPRLFPTAKLMILVRDGRAVVESGIKTFRWNREWAIQQWAQAARTIIRFDADHGGEDRHVIVRYEDLWRDLRPQLERIFTFLGLDPARYDFADAENLPVRGSSTVRSSGDNVHWQPVAKSADFDPMSRFRHWSPRQHARFNWVAGRELERFGHELCHDEPSTLARLQNVVMDGWWLVLRTLGPAYVRMRRHRRREAALRTEPARAASG